MIDWFINSYKQWIVSNDKFYTEISEDNWKPLLLKNIQYWLKKTSPGDFRLNFLEISWKLWKTWKRNFLKFHLVYFNFLNFWDKNWESYKKLILSKIGTCRFSTFWPFDPQFFWQVLCSLNSKKCGNIGVLSAKKTVRFLNYSTVFIKIYWILFSNRRMYK